jgi:Ca-activated chloride channel homolog
VEVQVVRVPAIVTDSAGRPVKGLAAADFTLTDNGQPARIANVWSEDLPLTVGLVLDVSESQMKVLEQNRTIMRDFLRGLLRPQDRVFLTAFTGQVRLFHDLTPSGDAVMDVAAKIHTPEQVNGKSLGPACRPLPPPRGQKTLKKPPKTCGGSAVWHALYWSIDKLKADREGRKALVLITDGQDSGSDKTLEQVLAHAQRHGVVVYAVGVGGRTGRPEAALNAADLRRLGKESGGAMFPEDMSAQQIFEVIDGDLRSQYVLGFSPASACDGTFHALAVSAGPGRTVRTRTGYPSECR